MPNRSFNSVNFVKAHQQRPLLPATELKRLWSMRRFNDELQHQSSRYIAKRMHQIATEYRPMKKVLLLIALALPLTSIGGWTDLIRHDPPPRLG
jgi:hypothetical protein